MSRSQLLWLRRSIALSLGFTTIGSTALFAQTISYSGGTYSQNFNTLPKSNAELNPALFVDIDPMGGSLPGVSDDMLGVGPFDLSNVRLGANNLAGWQIGMFGGSGGNDNGGGPNNRFKVNNGSVSGGATQSWGITDSDSERALGALGSSTIFGSMGSIFANDTGITLTQFTINFTMEQWRHGDQNNPNTTFFEYNLIDNRADIAGGLTNYVSNSLLNLVSVITNDPPSPPAPTATNASMNLNGNLAVNRANKSATITGISWAPGTNLVLRWRDPNDAGQDDGLGIDDFSFSAVGGGLTLTWNPTAPTETDWNTTDADNWLNGANSAAFAATNSVLFGDTGIGTVNIDAAGVTPNLTTVNNNSGTYTFTGGNIDGPGSLIKSGAGTLILNNSNGFLGGVNVSGGVLQISGDAALGAAGTGISLNGGELRLTGNINSTRTVLISASGGTLNTNGNDFTTTTSMSIDGPFVKSGAGILTVKNTIASSGPMSVTGGTLVLDQPIGTQNTIASPDPGQFAGDVIITQQARWNINGGIVSGGGAIKTLTSAAAISVVSTTGSTKNTLIGNNIQLNLNNAAAPFFTYLGATQVNTLRITGNISGNSDIVVAAGESGGSGTLALAGTNTFSGNVIFNNDNTGVLRIDSETAYPATAKLIFGLPASTRNLGAFDLNGKTVTVAGLHQQTTGIVLGIANSDLVNAGNLIINDTTGATNTLMGRIGIPQLVTGFLTGIPNDNISITLAATNTSKQVLNSPILNPITYTYSGGTNINGGSLIVNASMTGSGPVTVNGSGTLGGTGSILAPVSVNANGGVAPGDGAGTLTLDSLNLNQALFNFDLDMTVASDLLNVTSGLTAAGVSTFSFTNLGGLAAGTYTLIDYGTLTGGIANFNLSSPTLGAFSLALDNDAVNGAIVLNVTPFVGTPQWVGGAGGNWTAAGSWLGGVPNSDSAEASFLGMGSSPANLDASQTVNKLTFNSAAAYTLSGPAANVLSLAGTTPTISLAATNAGTQTIRTSLNLGNNTAINVDGGTLVFDLPIAATSTIGTNVTVIIGADDKLQLNGSISALGSLAGNKIKITTSTATSTFSVNGSGQVVGRVIGPTSIAAPFGAATGNTTISTSSDITLGGLRQNKLTLAAGTLAAPTKLNLAANGGSNGLIVVNNTAANGGNDTPGLLLGNDSVVDIVDNDIVLFYSGTATDPNPTATVQGYINNFYNSATGVPVIASQGIIDTGGQTVFVAIDNGVTGFGDGAVGSTFYDLTLGNSTTSTGFNQTIVRYTWGGDYDLNGVVDALDYAIVDANLGATAPGGVGGWQIGDGDFDGMVTALDYSPIDANLGKGGPLSGAAINAIPEPSVWVLGSLAAVGLGMLGLRRRSK